MLSYRQAAEIEVHVASDLDIAEDIIDKVGHGNNHGVRHNVARLAHEHEDGYQIAKPHKYGLDHYEPVVFLGLICEFDIENVRKELDKHDEIDIYLYLGV